MGRWNAILRRRVFLAVYAIVGDQAIASPPCLLEVVSPRPELRASLTGAIAADGDTLVMGDDNPMDGVAWYDWGYRGRVLVHRRDGADWREEAVLLAADGQLGDDFGTPLAIQGDTLVVGALGDDDACPPNFHCDAGAVYVFTRTGDIWTQRVKLLPDPNVLGRRFGWPLAIDGGRILVGATREQVSGGRQGAVYVFEGEGASWTRTAKLTGDVTPFGGGFGEAIALQGDVSVVGARWEYSMSPSGTGSVYVFRWNGTTWAREAKLRPVNPAPGWQDHFGESVAIDGQALIVGTEMWEYDIPAPGRAYIFEHNGSTWAHQATLSIRQSFPADHFGRGVALQGDYSTITAPEEAPGVAYVFQRSGSQWSRTAEFVPVDENIYLGPVTMVGTTAFFAQHGSFFYGPLQDAGFVYLYDVANVCDCNGNGVEDACDVSCGASGGPCDVSGCGTSLDCNGNDIPDECLAKEGDCNGNLIPDACDIAGGISVDCNGNGVPDECLSEELDCNNNGVPDRCDIESGISEDCALSTTDCCREHGTSGCSVPTIQDCVCAWRPSCCTSTWDSLCVFGVNYRGCGVCGDGAPDECEDDCNNNGLTDSCEALASETSDCNGNLIPDACDITQARSIDEAPAGGDGIPDECQEDCNGNHVLDVEDIAQGTSLDCNENEEPDECDIYSGYESGDCNGNSVPDSCDIASGVSDDCANPSSDCCEEKTTPGCNNPEIMECVCDFDSFCCVGTWDSYCVDWVTIRECGVCPNRIPDECEYISGAVTEPLAVEKNRYISLVPDRKCVDSALRVRLVNVAGFPAFNGQVRWAGPAGVHPDTTSGVSFAASALQCAPHVQEWPGMPPLHLYGAEIVPGSIYEVQSADAACLAMGVEDCLTPVLTIRTGKWGDIITPFGGLSQPNFGDISALVDAFRGVPGALSKARAQLRPNVPNPGGNLSFADISDCVGAFRGFAYPYAGPIMCP